MKRGRVIATCLMNSGLSSSVEECELAVRRVFDENFSNESYAQWNIDLHDSTAENIIRAVGRASHIRIDQFIDDLRGYR